MDLHGGHHWILGGHFRLFTSQYLAVIGPNGSGKSTLVKALPRRLKDTMVLYP